MLIDSGLISYLEDLSRITLSDGEKQRLKADLNSILNAMSRLDALDTADTAECCHPFENANDFREDRVTASLEREQILANAPRENGEMFIAPKTVD